MSRFVQSATKSSAQALLGTKGSPSGLSNFLAGFALETNVSSSEEEGPIMMHLKLMDKSSDITKQKSLREIGLLIRDMDENKLSMFVSNIIHVIINHSHHPNQSVRLATYVVLHALMEKGKAVKQAMVPDLQNLSGPWLMAMQDSDSSVQNEAVEAFNAAFSPEKRSLMLLKYKDNVLRYAFQQIEKITENGALLPAVEKETMANTTYSALLTLGYLIKQVSASQAPVMSFLETSVLLKLLLKKGKENESERKVYLLPSVRCGVLTLLREVVTVCPLSATIHALVARTLELSILDPNVYIAKRVWELLLCWCMGAGTTAIIPYFSKKFLETIIESMMKCETEGLAEIIFPSIFPLLGQLSKSPSCDGVIDEFSGALIEKIHFLMEKQPHLHKVLFMICKSLLSCWVLHSIRHTSNNSKNTLELFTVILVNLSDLLVAEATQHELLLNEIGSALADSLLKTLGRNEELFMDCMRVLCAAEDAPFVVFTSQDGTDGGATLPSREGYHHLQNAAIGFMCREMMKSATYSRWVGKLEECFAENLRLHVKEYQDLSHAAMTIRFADPMVFVPTHATAQWIGTCLTHIFQQWWTPNALEENQGEMFNWRIPCDEENIRASKYILEAVLQWKELISEKDMETLIQAASTPEAHVIVRRCVEEYWLNDDEKSMTMLLEACRTSNLENLNRYIHYKEKKKGFLEFSDSSVQNILQAIGEALDKEIGILENSFQLDKEVSGCNADEKNNFSGLSDASLLSPAGNTDPADEDGHKDSVSDSDDLEVEENPHQKKKHFSLSTTAKAKNVSHRLQMWAQCLHPHKGTLGRHFQNENALQNFFFPLVGEKMVLLLSFLSPCLYPEYYISSEALSIVRQGKEDDVTKRMLHKMDFVTAQYFQELSHLLKDLFTVCGVPTVIVDEWYEKLWNRFLGKNADNESDDSESGDNEKEESKEETKSDSTFFLLVAVQQIQQLLPLASPKLLRAIVSSKDVWDAFQIEPVHTLHMASLFDGHYTLDQMHVSLYFAVRTAQMIRLFDFCEVHSYFAADDSKTLRNLDRIEKQRAKRFYFLLRSATALRLFSSTTQAQLKKLLRSMVLQFSAGRVPEHLAGLIIETESEMREQLICTLASVLHDMANNLESLEKPCFSHFVQKIGGYLTEFMIREVIPNSELGSIKAFQVSYYTIFFQLLDTIADALQMNLLISISPELLLLFKEAGSLLTTFDYLTVKMYLVIHRHLAVKLEINELTVKSLILYAQSQNLINGLEVLVELSCCRVLHPPIFGELVRCIIHSMSRVYPLKHLPSNGRLIQASSLHQAEQKRSFEFLWRSVMAAITARKGIILHNRLDSVLRGTVNLLIFDAVCECVSHLRDANRLKEVPHFAKLIASTVVFLSTLQPEDISVLRASESSTHTIASMFTFAYLWLCATPLPKLEAIGLDRVAGVMRAACLLANLTLVHSGIPLTSQLDAIISKLPTKPLRTEFSSSKALKLRVYRRHNTLLRRTRKHSLALFPFLLGWGAYLTNTSSSPDQLEKFQRTSVYTLLDLLLTLMLSPKVPGSSHLDSTFVSATCSLKEEKGGNYRDPKLGMHPVHECESLATNIGTALHPLMCPDSHDLMSALAKTSEVLFIALLQGSTFSIVKDWLDTVEKTIQDLIFRFVRCRISPVIVKEALKGVLSHSPDGKPAFSPSEAMTVEVSLANRDILLTYAVEEDNISVRITFPSEYPLAPSGLEYGSRERVRGVSVKKWRWWMMKMMTKLFGGSFNIWDSIVLFQRNLEAHFEGVEPCPICYSIISSSDAKMPTVQCATCNNSAKFHMSCLVSWWSKSEDITCPLCRALWVV